MDALRGVAALLIILLHASVVMRQHGLEPDPTLVAINDASAGFRIPLLMILSGMLLPRALSKPAPTYLAGKISSLLYPYVLWAALFGLAFQRDELLWPWYWLGGSYLWFLLFLFTYYVIALMLRNVRTVALILLAGTVSFLSPEDTKYAERYFFLMAMFFVGKLFAEKQAWFDRATTPTAALLTSICAVAVSILSVADNSTRYKIEVGVLIVGAVLFLMWAGKAAASSKLSHPLQFIGRHAIVFYVAHQPFVFLVTGYCLIVGVRDALFISLLALAAALAALTALAVLRAKMGWGEWLYILPERLKRVLAAAMEGISRSMRLAAGRNR